MKYTVSINEKKRIVTVNLDGYVGEAKCCPTDNFCLSTGIELALERARVAKKNASIKPTPTKSMGVIELAEALQKALPKGQMVLVGEGDELTEAQKKWLADLAGIKPCNCHEGYTEDEMEDARHEAYEEDYDSGYNEGYADGENHKEAELAEAYDEGYSCGYESGRNETKSLLVGMLEDVISDLE